MASTKGRVGIALNSVPSVVRSGGVLSRSGPITHCVASCRTCLLNPRWPEPCASRDRWRRTLALAQHDLAHRAAGRSLDAGQQFRPPGPSAAAEDVGERLPRKGHQPPGLPSARTDRPAIARPTRGRSQAGRRSSVAAAAWAAMEISAMPSSQRLCRLERQRRAFLDQAGDLLPARRRRHTSRSTAAPVDTPISGDVRR